MDKKYDYSIRWTQAYDPLQKAKGWRKRQVIDAAVAHLHNLQLDMIDEAVEKSDLRQAKEVIDYIRNKE